MNAKELQRYSPYALLGTPVDISLSTAAIHNHTKPYSDGFASPEAYVDTVLGEYGVDLLIITDHNSLKGSEKAMEYAVHLGYGGDRVMSGVEVTTSDGHVLAIGVDGEIPRDRSAEETNYLIHKKHGLSFVAHPQLRFAKGMRRERIRKVMENPYKNRQFDGLEGLNGSGEAMRNTFLLGTLLFPENSNREALCLWEQDMVERLALIGGMDEHGKRNMVTVLTQYPGHDFREAIKKRQTRVIYLPERLQGKHAFEEAGYMIGAVLKTKYTWYMHHKRIGGD
ncbi:MAG TPA: hypothetical protein VGT05_03150 [Patescibacteria group bacterium]|nr:hypothetical protein [Patescibacteria group bacterium]